MSSAAQEQVQLPELNLLQRSSPCSEVNMKMTSVSNEWRQAGETLVGLNFTKPLALFVHEMRLIVLCWHHWSSCVWPDRYTCSPITHQLFDTCTISCVLLLASRWTFTTSNDPILLLRCSSFTGCLVEAISNFIKTWLYFFFSLFLLERRPTKWSRRHNRCQSSPPIGTRLLFVNGPGRPDWQPAVLCACGANNHGASQSLFNFGGGSQTHACIRTHLKSGATVSKFETAHTARCFLGGASMPNPFQLKYDNFIFFFSSMACYCALHRLFAGCTPPPPPPLPHTSSWPHKPPGKRSSSLFMYQIIGLL